MMSSSASAGFFSGVRRCFTSVSLDRESGLIAHGDVKSAEYIARLRRWNFWEAVIVFVLVWFVVWCAYWLDEDATKTCRMVLAIPTMAWMFIVSPIVHYYYEKDVFVPPHLRGGGLAQYFWEFRGLGNPYRYYIGVGSDPPLLVKHWRVVVGVLAVMTLLYLSAAYTFSAEIDKRYAAHYASFGGKAGFIAFLIVALNSGWLFLGCPFMVRLDNFSKALRFIVAFLAASFVFILLFNLFFQICLEPFRGSLENWHFIRLRGELSRDRLSVLLDPLGIGGQWSGYVTWGWIQQLIFASYFGILFGRAFPVEQSRMALFKACLCTAAAFSLIHTPNVWLMVFTFFGGIFGTLYFYQMSNLFALGFSHGFAGSLLNQLTPINFSVGPDQMPGR